MARGRTATKTAAAPLANGGGANGVAQRGRKRKVESEAKEDQPAKTVKRAKAVKAVKEVPKLEFRGLGGKDHVVLCCGQGDTGQIGLGEDILERKRPALVKIDCDGIQDICAGGMHSVALTTEGNVYTFGCNDEGSLGRNTPEDEECFTPAKVEIPGNPKIVQITAGDSHTVALTEEGRCWYWGTFRDGSGSFGLTANGIEKLPVALAHHLNVTKVASGSDHVVMLTDNGKIFTVGTGEQGQLGRISQKNLSRGGRGGVDLFLNPGEVQSAKRSIRFKDVWAGSYSTYALASDDTVHVCGLNNYFQLGMKTPTLLCFMTKSPSFTRLASEAGLAQVAPGQHHSLALDKHGRVYAVGRAEYGRLGLGEGQKEEIAEPARLEALEGVKHIGSGSVVSFAAGKDGVFSWGMGTNMQLSHEEEDEDAYEPTKMLGKQLETRSVVMASGGGQHTMLLAKNNE